MLRPRARGGCCVTARIALLVLLAAPSAANAATWSDKAPDVAVKAAFLFNFAKFATWPALPAGAPIDMCVVGDGPIASALAEMVRGRPISGHAVAVVQPQQPADWRACHVLFLSSEYRHNAPNALGSVRALPVLTVSDDHGFARAGGGLIELYLQDGRTRFAINVDAVQRSGLRLSTHLLQLARIERDGHAQ